MNVLGIIPARYASTRLPGKPLMLIHGKTMIERVYDQSLKAKGIHKLVVATDDLRIEQEVKRFGGNVVLTSPLHKTGTERCAEVLSVLNSEFDVVVNIQGDEPFINPKQIEEVLACFTKPTTQIATLVKTIEDLKELSDPNRPKVVLNCAGEALYFSRQIIPFVRDNTIESHLKQGLFYKHIGLYAYKSDVLKHIVTLLESPLERSEKLEQLRWLEHGFKIQTAVTEIDSQGIDTEDDLNKANQL